MSTASEIVALEKIGQLTRHVPPGPRSPKRRLFLTEHAIKDLTDSASATNVLVGRGYIEAALARWSLGDKVFGDEKRGRFVDRLKPASLEVWEVRVTEPAVQARLFGRFAEPDTLILSRFHTRNMLGKKGSAAWAAAIGECQKTWAALFPTSPPFIASNIHAYVTENCDDFPI